MKKLYDVLLILIVAMFLVGLACVQEDNTNIEDRNNQPGLKWKFQTDG